MNGAHEKTRYRQQLGVVGQPECFREGDAEKNGRDHHSEQIGTAKRTQDQELDQGRDRSDRDGM